MGVLATPFGCDWVRLATPVGCGFGVADHPWWLQIFYIYKYIREKTNVVWLGLFKSSYGSWGGSLLLKVVTTF